VKYNNANVLLSERTYLRLDVCVYVAASCCTLRCLVQSKVVLSYCVVRGCAACCHVSVVYMQLETSSSQLLACACTVKWCYVKCTLDAVGTAVMVTARDMHSDQCCQCMIRMRNSASYSACLALFRTCVHVCKLVCISEYMDQQTLKLQESPEVVPTG
jgi:hypothetical protein